MDRLNKIIDKSIEVKVESLDAEERSFIAVATAEVVDREGDVIMIDGIDYERYLKNPVLFFNHDWGLPIGRVLWLKKTEKGVKKLIFKGQIHDKFELANTVFELMKEGYIKGVSIGFLVKEAVNEKGIRKILASELVEISIVSIPANVEAEILEVSKKNFNLAQSVYNNILKYKRAVAIHNTEVLDEDEEWNADKARHQLRIWASSDGSGDKDTIDWSKYRQGFAWYNEDDEENFSSYKLPHHYVKNGELYVCWRGVAAAMAALLGARGGVDIPKDDVEGVYKHLANHYKQFGKEPPELTSYTQVELELMFKEIFDNSKVVEGEIRKLKQFLLDIIPSLGLSELSAVDKDSRDNRKTNEGIIKIKD